MIGMRTILEVADNSGARRLHCILPQDRKSKAEQKNCKHSSDAFF